MLARDRSEPEVQPVVALARLDRQGISVRVSAETSGEEIEMVEVTESVSVAADANAAWELIGDPSALAEWHPAIDSSEVENDLRHLILGDGGRIEERITEQSGRSYSYEFIESPLPVGGYSSRLSVEPSDRGATISWSSTFEAQGASESEAEELIAGIYRAGLDAVAQRLG